MSSSLAYVGLGSNLAHPRRQIAREWASAWSAQPPAPWQVALIEIEGGTHAATIGEAYRRAMRWLFEPAAATPRGKPGP